MYKGPWRSHHGPSLLCTVDETVVSFFESFLCPKQPTQIPQADLDSMFGLLTALVDYIAPIFLIASPITSYADQIVSIHRSKSSAGFSLDIPLIMLVASILKVFYWFGAYYDKALLVQASLMIAVQLVLLKVALDNKAPTGARDGLEHAPFSGYSIEGTLQDVLAGKRPFNFWRWPSSKPLEHQPAVSPSLTIK